MRAKRVIRHPELGYRLTYVPGGCFLMGSPDSEVGRDANEGPIHEVDLDPFYVGICPVTQEEFSRFLTQNPEMRKPTYLSRPEDGLHATMDIIGPSHPAVDVTWAEANAFCDWAGLSLLTEAQWEFACRAGTATAYWSGSSEADLARVGWYATNSPGGSKPVGMKPANPFGLHDMHGNVWEWCREWYDPAAYEKPPGVHDGFRDTGDGKYRVVRGGCWFYSARVARSASRTYGPPDLVGNLFFGFRCALSAAAVEGWPEEPD